MEGDRKRDILRNAILITIIAGLGILMANSYNDLYAQIYEGPQVETYGTAPSEIQDLSVGLDFTYASGTEYVTKIQFINGLIEALNIVICIVGITMSFNTLITRNKISLLDLRK